MPDINGTISAPLPGLRVSRTHLGEVMRFKCLQQIACGRMRYSPSTEHERTPQPKNSIFKSYPRKRGRSVFGVSCAAVSAERLEVKPPYIIPHKQESSALENSHAAPQRHSHNLVRMTHDVQPTLLGCQCHVCLEYYGSKQGVMALLNSRCCQTPAYTRQSTAEMVAQGMAS